MATLEQTKEVLRGLRRGIIITQSEGSTFSFKHRHRDYTVTGDEIDTYFKQRTSLKKTTETQIFSPGHYEHAIQFEGSPYYNIYRAENALTLENPTGTIRIEISKPSTIFCLSTTDTDKINKDLRLSALSEFSSSRSAPAEKIGLRDLLLIHTIKVNTSPTTLLGNDPSRLHELAEAATFNFAYTHGISISFLKTWTRSRHWIIRKEAEKAQFPLRTYNTELVGYYNLALASDSLFLGYLALYKILEYFYTSASESALHKKMKTHLVAPDFSHTKTQKLRDLAKAIRQFDTRLDELSALKYVLAAYFDKSELRQWIETYEADNSPHFTEKKTIFNTPMQVDTSDTAILPNIASRIYSIRNALVHNKEGEISRFVPYTGQEETLQKEVQILL
ncbi:hypothetical protein [Myxococcus sp. SDU36]|uniref:hypothetical protein n=1 Tax=Myxococcus sp. SDU36 TaxID=2831967 RepID=UPI002543365D|nr:hypothetical protein [Myxococcus sp. SDU36]WIG98332.1 hypothetical protein KGD87_13630 [Myxococcus sp. SDU36]